MNETDMEGIGYLVVINDIDCKGINVIDLVKHVLNKKCEVFHTHKKDNGHFIVSESGCAVP